MKTSPPQKTLWQGPVFLPIKFAAIVFGVTNTTVLRHIRQGAMPADDTDKGFQIQCCEAPCIAASQLGLPFQVRRRLSWLAFCRILEVEGGLLGDHWEALIYPPAVMVADSLIEILDAIVKEAVSRYPGEKTKWGESCPAD